MAEKILIVEDERLSRNSIGVFLEDAGYEVEEAADGAQALEMIAKEPFNLVITDFVMPHVDGIRLIELIRAKFPEIPVLLMTGYLSPRAGNAILSGQAEVLNKPLQLDKLLNTVQRMLQTNAAA
jgi:two-component system response regulator FlrC